MSSHAATSRAERAPLASRLAAWPTWVAGGTLAAVLVALAWQRGGYFPGDHLTAGAVTCVVLGVLVVLEPPRLSPPALLALAALAALTVWTGLSSLWSPAENVAVEDVQRDLVYVAVLGLAVVGAGSGRHASLLPWFALAVLATVCGGGLAARLYPQLIDDPYAYLTIGDYRLAYPIGYWNGLGIMGAMGALLGLGLAADPRRSVIGRAAAAGASLTCVTVLYLSLSRGAWVAGIAGAVALVLLARRHGALAVSGAIVAVGAVTIFARLSTLDALVEDPLAGDGQTAQAGAFAPFFFVVLGAVVGAQGAVAAGRRLLGLELLVERLRRPVALGLLGVALVGGAAVYVVASGRVEGGAVEAIDAAERWLDRQWDEFNTAGAPAGSQTPARGTERLKSARGTRSELYDVAFDGFAAAPLAGEGAGAFEIRWMRDRDINERVRDAHSLYIETLAELGLVGMALLVALVAAIVWAVVRARVRPGALGRSQSAAVSAALVAFFVHAGVDWDWQLPAVTGTALLLAAALLTEGRRRTRRGDRPTGAQVPGAI